MSNFESLSLKKKVDISACFCLEGKKLACRHFVKMSHPDPVHYLMTLDISYGVVLPSIKQCFLIDGNKLYQLSTLKFITDLLLKALERKFMFPRIMAKT